MHRLLDPQLTVSVVNDRVAKSLNIDSESVRYSRSPRGDKI
jgi:hypothetical protein